MNQKCINTSFVTQTLLTKDVSIHLHNKSLATGVSFYKNPLLDNVLRHSQKTNFQKLPTLTVCLPVGQTWAYTNTPTNIYRHAGCISPYTRMGRPLTTDNACPPHFIVTLENLVEHLFAQVVAQALYWCLSLTEPAIGSIRPITEEANIAWDKLSVLPFLFFLPLFFNLVLPLILLSSMLWSLWVDWFLISNNVQLKRLDNYRSVCLSSNLVWWFYIWFYPLFSSNFFVHLSINLFRYFTKISWIPVIVSSKELSLENWFPKWGAQTSNIVIIWKL